MSYSDFMIIPGYSNDSGTQYTGSSYLNSSLANPLTSSTQCRIYNLDNNGVNYIRANFLISSSISGASYVNIPETKSVSLRVWARIAGAGDSQGVSLLAKHNSRNTQLHGDNHPDNYPNSGYEFVMQGGSNGQLVYRFGGYRASNATGVQLSNNIGVDKWVGLRMDIVPVKVNKIINGTPISGNLKDIVTLYTASVNSPDTWSQVYTTEILATSNNYVPWNSYTCLPPVSNYGTPITTSSYGFSVSSNANNVNYKTYFDDFKIFIEDAF